MIQTKVRCREIRESDVDAVADLLTRGFVGRSRDYWIQGLRRQAFRPVPDGYPRFGYMLDNEGLPFGVLLLIYTARKDGEETTIQCNLSSWYVEPAYRNYAPLLTKIAQRHKEVTYLNISPAPWTWPIIETQGFRTYCQGLFISVPALSRVPRCSKIDVIAPHTKQIEGLGEVETELLTRHARYHCLSVVCRTPQGVFPFILQPVSIRRGRIAPPAMRLIYCRSVDEYAACAGRIGRLLLRFGKLLVLVDSNGGMTGVRGAYTERGRKYFKGPHCPQLGDLTDTELVLFGP
ncbi:acyl-CoA acyltransferase [Bradyrhizobium diazoefficiens]|uniref:acyl-CoA acyltransferase n=1 Tax=Bradyrhizobium diazoefficiens TaxID=1355477 RepID=UPI00190BA9F8|nr:acyl-CoA acyltransferase [Bradyrhizobium diazoefficiens]MBK3659711.1 acyl-CoA acyltransferase [Bradyrhizobium diazoefficiens]